MTISIMKRMKKYEESWRQVITPRMPVIIRVDGRAFHSYTRECKKPFDTAIIRAMWETAKALCSEIQGAEMAYVQSDEISVLVHNYKTHEQESWFGNQVTKMVSISAAIASTAMSEQSYYVFGRYKAAHFDSRAFAVPEPDVCNYFIARQQDWTRNSVQMLARSLYSQKELHQKHNPELQEMCFQKGHNWNDLSTFLKRGVCIVKMDIERDCTNPYCEWANERFYPGKCIHCVKGKVTRPSWEVDQDIPIFSRNRDYVEKYLAVDE